MDMLLNKLLHKITLLITLIILSQAHASSEIVGGTITPFFDALRQGDVITVESYLVDPLLSTVIVQLRDNHGYSDFLREYYDGTTVVVTNIESNSDSAAAIAYINIHFPEGYVESFRLDLIRDSGNKWKIQQQSEVRN